MALPPWLTTAMLGSAPQPPRDQALADYNNPNLPMWKRVGLQAPPSQLLSGPQQSYANASTLQASNDGVSGQAGRQESSYNNSPYQAPQGTISNTGQPAGPPQAGSQGELVGQGGQGWNIYQTTPTWTGSPLSQSPPARDEGAFNAPRISGPQPFRPQINPQHLQRIAALLAHYRALA